LRRRVAFEFHRRRKASWLDSDQVIDLSGAGFGADGKPPRMAVIPREMINQSLFLYGSFEISETRLIQALLHPGMTFVDVGANIGYYTVIAAHLVGSDGKVHAFEPHAEIRARLRDNVERNGYRNVIMHAEAMAASSGTVDFFANAFGANQGLSSIIPGRGQEASQRVPSVSLDDFAAGLTPKRIDVIKMDIEGAEPQVIAGGQRTLSAPDAPAIIFEAADLPPMSEPLRACGYRIKRHHYTLAGGLQLLDPGEAFDDIFATYEAPNYLAAKDEAVFTTVLAAANAARSPLLRWLGRI
jgi:FkbM family methyltransferase